MNKLKICKNINNMLISLMIIKSEFFKMTNNMNYVIKKMTTSFGNLKKFLHLYYIAG
jgi:glutaredoxin-related protein